MYRDTDESTRIFPGKELVAIIAALLAVNIIPAALSFRAAPDAVEYLSIARNLASGEGYTSSIKYHHFNRLPALHDASSERPFFYPALASIALRICDDPRSLQVANLLLFAVGIAVFYKASLQFSGKRNALIAAFLVSFNPMSIWLCTSALAEPLTFLLASMIWVTLLAALNRRDEYKGQYSLFLVISGLLLGALILTRTANAALVPGTLLGAALTGRGKASALKSMAITAAVSVAVLMLAQIAGSAGSSGFHSVGAMHYKVMRFDEAAAYSYLWESVPGQLEFIRENWFYMLSKITRKTVSYSVMSFIILFPMSFGIFRDISRRFRKSGNACGNQSESPPEMRLLNGDTEDSGKWILTWFLLGSWSLFAFLAAVLTYSVYDPRFVFLPVMFAIALAVPYLGKNRRGRSILRKQKILYISVGIILAISLAIIGTDPELENNTENRWVTEWVEENVEDGPLASDTPWKVYLLTGRPSVILPPLGWSDPLAGFLEEYDIKGILLHSGRRKRKYAAGEKERGADLVAAEAHKLMDRLETGPDGIYMEAGDWRLWMPRRSASPVSDSN